jgi:sec-independent protein translocase protein TatB
MPDIGWMELLVIGIVALIVVGPKDLPVMFRRLGQFTGRIRAMAKDFQRAMDEAADEAGVSDLNRDLKSATKWTSNPRKAGMDAFKDAFGDVDLDLDIDKYAEGSETRRLAEEKAAHQRKMRDEAIQRRKEKAAEATAANPATAAAATPETVPDAAPADPAAASEGTAPADPAPAPAQQDKP